MRLLENSRVLDDILAGQPILPVLSITRESDILPMADALAAAGITNLEVTLRTPLGLGAIRLLASERPQLCVGAGTVLDARQFQSVLDAGARFIVTPGTTDELLALGLDSPVPLLPGVATASEIMRGYRLGYRCFKLFPAEICGGVKLLKALAGPFHDVRFCPTGGIGPERLPDYLALDNVVAVGGSWMAPRDLIESGDWQAITRLCRQVPRRR
ncbi:MAG: bifunctional 4-hydroxy-2-oxoglutarate aldolase/2-dehydro-3-deoxy-phosphogluconate aldolase [Pseudomonadaceae bacterium]|jgi:2-dehydro-3-deoxyphosphogluconate aldolase/(4S)-4-hydroxy-2-oxoglutarate aldolase|uniref:2-dehydro-3-deoxy-phosphogluconate aldolase n=2 Tax=Pseudomonadaceae TaxID=135621 RepID=A0A1I6ATV1_9GAMM|nr:bifunctional 4-hydroxy-2-oxoglutarate aldolase/2-dehydro-3-deoxy-phosphogluconate aldolase [Halopseudomonas formosensis]MDX9687335.1 bifunctional 4-hydroxy-2-oxoglutarate aldolase/2-dehydro-3-deoxy-phosphogluconate aldolase [Halopseudomonas formosensis]MDY3197748.1 bifunctional 4-hydroxy-2-oxoglutarate aldolase/2-dehydro-3-deoxy-phosphogluconate aldolase [Pseudomonadaceae bacterium]NLC00717.1 bifunctional 4-hydroxy-2-oxoglutarate aldolase/2-dehydro-3-deoxy-phosphogluconate aldolase [Halopseud